MLFARAHDPSEEAGGEHFAGDVADGKGEVGAGAVDILQISRVIDASDHRDVGGRIARDHRGEERRVVAVESEDHGPGIGQAGALEHRRIENVADVIDARQRLALDHSNFFACVREQLMHFASYFAVATESLHIFTCSRNVSARSFTSIVGVLPGSITTSPSRFALACPLV